MKHRVGYNRLGRKPSHRKSLHRNMVTSLFRYERIRTTKTKAQAIRRTAEKMITRAKVDSVHNRRIVGKDLKDKAVLAKLFVELGPRFKERPGGYTRILKIGPRPGDAAEMVLLELVGDMSTEEAPKAKRGGSTKKASDKKPAGKTPEKEKSATKETPKAKKAAKAEEAVAEKAAEDTIAPADEPAEAAAEGDVPAEEVSADAQATVEETEPPEAGSDEQVEEEK